MSLCSPIGWIRSGRTTVWTSMSAPAQSSSSPEHGTVSPAMTTDRPPSSTRKPTVGRTGA